MRYRPVGPRKLTHSPDEDPWTEPRPLSRPKQDPDPSRPEPRRIGGHWTRRRRPKVPWTWIYPAEHQPRSRAALSTTGPHAKACEVLALAAASASVASPRPQWSGRAAARHGGPKRLGRIAAFVAVAAALSVGTAGALVMSNNASNQSVSLPASGAIPVAPSTTTSQSGGRSMRPRARRRPARHAERFRVPRRPSTSISIGRTTGQAHEEHVAHRHEQRALVGHVLREHRPVELHIAARRAGRLECGLAAALPGAERERSAVAGDFRRADAAEQHRLSAAVGDTRRRRAHHRASVYAAGPDPHGYYLAQPPRTRSRSSSRPTASLFTGVLGECDLATYQALVQVISASTSSSNQTPQ